MTPFKRLAPVLLAFGALALRAESTPTTDNAQGELSLPWGEFEKLLRLDQDNVLLTWEEFQRLIKQTGVQEMPSFQLQNGKVSLTRAEFRRLLDQMKPPAREGAKAFLTKATYTGRVNRRGTTVTAKIRLQVMNESAVYTPVRVPLFHGGMAFEEILLNGRPALVENENGETAVTAPKPGEHEITAVFSLPAALDKEPYRLSFNIPETPITQLDFFLAAPNLDARVDGAAQLESAPAEGGTRVRASLPQTGAVSVAWNAVEPERAKGPAKVYAVPHTLISVQDDAVRITSRIDLDVLQNTINNLTLQLPEGYTLLDVTGEAVGEWKTRGEGNRTLFIPFDYARKGRFSVTVRVERAFKEKGGIIPFDGLQVLGAVRESGDLLIEKSTNGDVKVVDPNGLIRLDPQEVPAGLRALSAQTFLDAYKYIRPPIRLGLDVQRHEEIAVVSSVVDTANAVTLLLKDGKCVTHVTLSVKNTAKQYLQMALPAGAEVWSVFVEGRPVKPSKNEKGATLVPLNRSRIDGQNLAAFDVEIMYFRNLGPGGPGGRQALEVPAWDLKTSQLLWSVYLPTERDYLYFGGTVDKEVQAGGLKPLAHVLKGQRRILSNLAESAANVQGWDKISRVSKDYEVRKEMARKSSAYQVQSEFDESQNINEEQFAQQVERELNFFGDMNRKQSLTAPATPGEPAGTLPIRIKVPNSGQIFRFSKVLVQEGEAATLTAWNVHRGVVWGLKALVVVAFVGLFIGGLLLAFRHRTALAEWTRKARGVVDRYPRELGWVRSWIGRAALLFSLSVLLLMMADWPLIGGFFKFAGVLGLFGAGALGIRWLVDLQQRGKLG